MALRLATAFGRAIKNSARREIRTVHSLNTIPERYRHFTISGISTQGQLLKVEWNDGAIGSFPLGWLKDSAVDCDGVFHITDQLKARTLRLAEWEPSEAPSDVSVSADGCGLVASWAGGLRASFPSAWLRFRNPCDAGARAERQTAYFRPVQTWGRAEAERIFANSWRWDEVLQEGQALHHCLHQLTRDGLVVIDAPARKGQVSKLIRLLNYATMTHFGYEWCVDIKPEPINLGYTPKRIGLHTDEPALECPPNVMALHFVVQAQGDGGQTELADGFHISKLLKEEQPEAYELLSTYPLEFMDEGGDGTLSWDLLASHKVIDLASDGRQRACFFSGHQRGWFFGDLPARRIPEMYEALKLFNSYAYQPRNLYRRKMREGEMILIANNRLLHGRTGLQAGDSRSVEGCYFDWDVVHSKIRFLRDKIAHPDNQPSF